MMQLMQSERYELMTDVFILLLPFYERRDYHVSLCAHICTHANTGSDQDSTPNKPLL